MNMLMLVLLIFAVFALPAKASAQIGPCHSTDRFLVECIKPSATDPMIQRFDHPHFVMIDRSTLKQKQPLMVFLPGTKGQPPGPLNFLRTAATHGYRVISLEYNDEPSIAVFCPEHGVPPCSARMRHMRIYGNTTLNPSIDNTRHEAIVERLYRLLEYLHQQAPQNGWDEYFNQHGMMWEKIALSGQSQGAGMAAFIGKQKLVNRIILFSSPWDFYHAGGRQRILAPWLEWESKTPMNRWFAGYNARENTAELLSRAYQTLRIPENHIRIFNLPLPDDYRGHSDNPFHTQGISNKAYEQDWIFFLTAPYRD